MSHLPLQLAAAIMALAAAATACRAFQIEEATVDAIHLGFKNGSLTSTALVRFYLDRIARLNPLPHAVIEDNIATRDRLNTTAGSLALLGSVVRRDAGVAARLRAAGAVILGKSNPAEWSSFRPLTNGWSARGGETLLLDEASSSTGRQDDYGAEERREAVERERRSSGEFDGEILKSYGYRTQKINYNPKARVFSFSKFSKTDYQSAASC
uniref:Amidase domain-containing protein n=1 Tax=Oryza meridionalis TaxID=40149 RepID=A0A0E0DAY7_9ORYZ